VTDGAGLRPLPRAFYARPTAAVARELLGKVLVRRLPEAPAPLYARIVECEAYLGLRDAASHARRGPTPRTAIMFGPPGYLYVYLIYGMYHCMNFVAETDGEAGAVLIRAAVFLDAAPAAVRLLSGPGKLCAGLAVTLAHKGLDLTAAQSVLFVADDGAPAPRVATSARIGVESAGPGWARRRLRFYVPGHPAVSGPRGPGRRTSRGLAGAGQ
jgi:DNA-3-methyladenine glycosylase